MATNTGIKIFRDFFRDSPCRKAYLLTQQKNLSHQFAKNNSLRKTLPVKSRQLEDTRPKTAPILPSNLAQAVFNHNLLDGWHPERKRPTTSGKVLKRRDMTPLRIRRPGSGNKPSIPSRPRKPVEDTVGRRSPPTASDNARGKQKQPKHVKSKIQNRKSSIKPCKICIDGEECFLHEQWRRPQQPSGNQAESSNGFRHLVQEIDNIRSELMDSDSMKQISYEDSLRLINDIKQKVDAASEKGDIVARILSKEPFQMTLLSPEKTSKKVKITNVGLGRVSDEDFKSMKGPILTKKDSFKTKNQAKYTKKSFEQGPLRMLVPFMKGALTERQFRF